MRNITTNINILTENSKILQDFFRDIYKFPILDGQTQAELARKAKKGDLKAREQLIKSNLRFVITCAKHYTNQGVPLVDLIQCGIVGLILSIQNYDPDRGYKFISFAVWYIRREILKEIYATGRTIRYPVTYISKITKVKKAYEGFVAENQRDPSDEELIQLTNLTQKQLDSAIMDKSYCVSLDTPVSDDGKLTAEDLLVVEDIPFTDTFTKDSIESALKCLSPREYKVVTEYYGLCGAVERPVRDIAKELQLGSERVRQIRKGAIKKLYQKKGESLKTLL